MSDCLKSRVALNFKSVLLLGLLLAVGGHTVCPAEVLRYHTLVVDGQNKIMPWFTPAANAFDNYLDKCWSWAVAAPNDAHGLPISFLYCAWNPGNPPTASTSWENDVGEKIPNWVESARLYYQYTGDRAPLDYVKRLVDYSLDHGQTPTNHVWPGFPVGTANAGDTEFRGFTGVWGLWDCHVDLAADTGFAMYRMYQMYGDLKYRDKAIHVADLLASRIVAGSATDSPWPYVVNSQTGANKSRYAASWDGALQLFDLLIKGGRGSVSSYTSARATLKNWLLTYPMQNGNWVDSHSDIKIDGTGNWSTTCASDMCLYLLDHPDWDPNFLTDVPKLLKWTEDNFVNVSTPDGLSGQYHGAYVPAEQTGYMYRMGYQAARLGAQYAQWYAVSGDPTYKDKAYRCLSYNTYMMQNNGQSSDGPTDTVGYWWSDCYGEATRMYYYGLSAVPEWATPGENHLLRSSSVVTSINYASNSINYTTFNDGSTETLRIAFAPAAVMVNSVLLPERVDLTQPGWVFTASNSVLRIRHDTGTNVLVQASALRITLTSPVDGMRFAAPASINLVATAATATGSVLRVEFYDGPIKLGESTAEPFTLAWTNVPMGDYFLTARGTDTAGNPGTSAVVSVTVVGALAQIALAPANAAVPPGGVQQFQAIAMDTIGHVLVPQPAFAWSVNGGGTIDGTGLFRAGNSAGGPFDVIASSGGISGAATASVALISGGSIGNPNEGTLTDFLWNSGAWINASRFQAASNMTVTTMFARVRGIAGAYKCAIYADNGGETSAFLCGTVEVRNPTSGWNVFPLTRTLVLTNGQYYWLAIWSDSANAQVYYSGSGGTLRWQQVNYGSWPDPMTTTGGGNFNYCIYGTNNTPPLVMTTSNLPSGKVGVAYSFQLTAAGGVAPYTWTLVANATTPAGLTLSTNGVLSGVPSVAGQFSFSVGVADSTSAMTSQDMHLGIEPLILTLGIPSQSAEEIGSLGFRLTIFANEPGTYLIQRTPDFKVWEDVRQVVYTNGVVEVTDNGLAGAQTLFYRAVRQ